MANQVPNLQPIAPPPPNPQHWQTNVTNSLNQCMVAIQQLQQGQQQLQQGQQQLQQGQQQLQQGQQQLQQQLQQGQQQLQQGQQQQGAVLNNIQQLLQQALLVGAIPATLEERNAARLHHNKLAARNDTVLLPIFSAAGLLPNVLFPQTISGLYVMTNPQLAALLAFYNIPGANLNKARKITLLRRFIVGE
jgi:uncharacterized phage infection (PIP) family protein YhgE